MRRNVLFLSYVCGGIGETSYLLLLVYVAADGDGILILCKACIERCYGCLSETFCFKMFLIISDKHALNKVNVIKMVP